MSGLKIKPYVVGALGTNCYLVWDEESKEAMIVDPGAYDPAFERDIEAEGLELKYIALTHGHGDHIGGVPGLKEIYPGAALAAGAKESGILGSPKANASALIFRKNIALTAELALSEGDALSLGELSFKVIETPGHTPGGVCYYTHDHAGEENSGTVFTGDTLFRASIGRTDLEGGDFGTLMSSIREKLFELPDDTLALPGHMGATTIGYEKKFNPFVK